jgi:hypothetical protein
MAESERFGRHITVQCTVTLYCIRERGKKRKENPMQYIHRYPPTPQANLIPAEFTSSHIAS